MGGGGMFFHDGGKTKPITPKKNGITRDKFGKSSGKFEDVIRVNKEIQKHAERTAKKTEHNVEILTSDAKSDVDEFFNDLKKTLQDRNPNIVMTSDLLEARPFQEDTVFLVSFEDKEKDKILKQFHVREGLDKIIRVTEL